MQRKCSFCGESIPPNTGRCPYCASILDISFGSDYNMASYAANQDENKAGNENEPLTGSDDREILDNSAKQDSIRDGDKTADGLGNRTAPRENVQGSNLAFQSRIQVGGSQNSNNNRYSENRTENMPVYPLSNGMKVFLTVIFTLIPGIGQLAGIITAIIFMNNEYDSDRKSFGVAILVASLIMFVLSCIGCFIAVLAISSSQYVL